MGTGSFLGVKYGWGVLLTTHPLLVPWSWKSRAITLPTLWVTTGLVTGTLFMFMSCGSCHCGTAHPQVVDGGEATMGWSSRWRMGTPTTKYQCYDMLKRVMDWDGSFGMT